MESATFILVFSLALILTVYNRRQARALESMARLEEDRAAREIKDRRERKAGELQVEFSAGKLWRREVRADAVFLWPFGNFRRFERWPCCWSLVGKRDDAVCGEGVQCVYVEAPGHDRKIIPFLLMSPSVVCMAPTLFSIASNRAVSFLIPAR